MRNASLLAIFIRAPAQKTELSFTCADRKVLAHPDGVLGPASQVGEAVALFLEREMAVTNGAQVCH
jgi:hypothetical protein